MQYLVWKLLTLNVVSCEGVWHPRPSIPAAGVQGGSIPCPLTVSAPHGVEEYIQTPLRVSTRASPFHPRSQHVHAQFFRTLKTAACKPVLNEIHLHVRVVSTENNSHFLHFHHRRHLHFYRQYLQVSVK